MNLSNKLRGVVCNRGGFCMHLRNQKILRPRIGSTFEDIQLLLAFLRYGHHQGGDAKTPEPGHTPRRGQTYFAHDRPAGQQLCERSRRLRGKG